MRSCHVMSYVHCMWHDMWYIFWYVGGPAALAELNDRVASATVDAEQQHQHIVDALNKEKNEDHAMRKCKGLCSCGLAVSTRCHVMCLSHMAQGTGLGQCDGMICCVLGQQFQHKWNRKPSEQITVQFQKDSDAIANYLRSGHGRAQARARPCVMLWPAHSCSCWLGHPGILTWIWATHAYHIVISSYSGKPLPLIVKYVPIGLLI